MNELNRLNEFRNIAPDMINDNKPLVDYLVDNGFFKAPASTKHHGDYAGGLYDHSRRVFENLQWLTDGLKLSWMRPESPFIVGMFHDLCKIDQYLEVVDNPGKVMFGSDEPEGQKVHYEYIQPLMLNGHGSKSVMLLSTFLRLTEEEMLCIRYHMGAYERDDWKPYDLAIKKYPNVLFTHTADMFTSKVDKT